jgi:hypothetical protein
MAQRQLTRSVCSTQVWMGVALTPAESAEPRSYAHTTSCTTCRLVEMRLVVGVLRCWCDDEQGEVW